MENIRNWDGKIVESCTWSLIGSSHRVWKIGVLTVMQPHEVEVILFQWKIDWKTLGRGHFCDILAKKKKKKQKTFVLGLCPEILSRSNKQTKILPDLYIFMWLISICSIFLFLFFFPLRQSFSVSPWLSRNLLCRPGCPRTQKSPCLCLQSAGIKVVLHQDLTSPISLFNLHSNCYTHPIPPSIVPHHWLPFISPGRVGTTWVSPNYGMSSLCRVRHILSNWC